MATSLCKYITINIYIYKDSIITVLLIFGLNR